MIDHKCFSSQLFPRNLVPRYLPSWLLDSLSSSHQLGWRTGKSVKKFWIFHTKNPSVCGGAFVFTYERGHTFDIFPTNEDTQKTEDVLGFLKLAERAIQLKLAYGGRSPIGGNMSRSSLWQLSVRFSHKSPRFHCEKSECIGPRFCSEKSCVLGWRWKWVGVCVCLMFFVCLFFAVLYFVYLFVLYLIQDFCWKQHIVFPSPNTQVG